MDFEALLQDPLNRDIVSLLIVSNLEPEKKKRWIFLLPEMSFEEKNELKGHLEKEVQYEVEVTEKARNEFIAQFEKKIGQN